MPPPVFVINLPDSTQRRESVTRLLAGAGITPIVITAVDGRGLADGDISRWRGAQPHLGRPLSRAEIGCLLSHLSVLERIVADRLPLACVLEDDVRPGREFTAIISALEQAPPRWDLVLLGHHSARHAAATGAETCYARTPLTTFHSLARVAEFAMGAYAYAITAEGARKLLQYAYPLRMPMDWLTGYAPAAGATLYAVTPPCVTPDGDGSEVSTIVEATSGEEPSRRRASMMRTLGGRAFLACRKAGLWTDGFVRRY